MCLVCSKCFIMDGMSLIKFEQNRHKKTTVISHTGYGTCWNWIRWVYITVHSLRSMGRDAPIKGIWYYLWKWLTPWSHNQRFYIRLSFPLPWALTQPFICIWICNTYRSAHIRHMHVSLCSTQTSPVRCIICKYACWGGPIIWGLCPLLLTWSNFNPSMDK